MASEIISSFHVSAPSSPRVFNLDIIDNARNYCSMPTSPTRAVSKDSFDHDDVSSSTSPSGTTSTTSSAYYDDDDFEFETSCRFDMEDFDHHLETSKESHEQPRQKRRMRKASLPTMAFADELFCDGKLVPLKPPPCLHSKTTDEGSHNKTSPAASPSHPLLRIPLITRRNLWNDDFDPFEVALENVKDEKRGHHRRSRSMFALPSCMADPENPFGSTDFEQLSKKYHSMPNPSNQAEADHIRAPNTVQTAQNRPIKLAEPKGVLFARRARLVKLINEWPKKTIPELVHVESGETTKQIGIKSIGSWSLKETKRHTIKNFLFKNSSMRKTVNYENNYKVNHHEDLNVEQLPKPNKDRKRCKSMDLINFKEKKVVEKEAAAAEEDDDQVYVEIRNDQNLEIPKPKNISRKLSSKSNIGLGAQCKEDKRFCEPNSQMAIVQHGPRLLTCMGIGGKYVE